MQSEIKGSNRNKGSKERPETLYLIDGYASIFRAFYAIRQPLHSPVTGEPTQAVLVFAQMLLKLFDKLKPDYVALALDAPGRTFRDDLYEQYSFGAGVTRPQKIVPALSKLPVVSIPDPDDPNASQATETTPATGSADSQSARRYEHYKGGRRATPDRLHQQVPRILELLELFGVPVISKPGLEADDIIATLADRVLQDRAHPHLQVRIVSRDKDLEQLLSERVTLFDIHTEVETDIATLWQERGVAPGQVGDLLVLAGDPVDNIPGVDGIGPKTAAKLIRQFGSVEGVVENLGQINGWWRENLAAARSFLPLSRQLVTLKRDSELAFSLEAARVGPLPSAEIARFFEELGFARLKEPLERLTGSSSSVA